jgi:hypothetical protein
VNAQGGLNGAGEEVMEFGGLEGVGFGGFAISDCFPCCFPTEFLLEFCVGGGALNRAAGYSAF